MIKNSYTKLHKILYNTSWFDKQNRNSMVTVLIIITTDAVKEWYCTGWFNDHCVHKEACGLVNITWSCCVDHNSGTSDSLKNKGKLWWIRQFATDQPNFFPQTGTRLKIGHFLPNTIYCSLLHAKVVLQQSFTLYNIKYVTGFMETVPNRTLEVTR